jgi:hypothetical protein
MLNKPTTMANNQQLPLILKEKSNTVKCMAPLVFAIPRPYEDDYERDNSWFTKILKLEKKSQQLKEKLKELAYRNNLQYKRTRQLIAQAVELNKKLHEKHWPGKQRNGE